MRRLIPFRVRAQSAWRLRRILKRQGFAPSTIVTDKLGSYGAAKEKLGLHAVHEQGLRQNNRCENSHLPVRRREHKKPLIQARLFGICATFRWWCGRRFDANTELRFTFPTLGAAVSYAEQHEIDYRIKHALRHTRRHSNLDGSRNAFCESFLTSGLRHLFAYLCIPDEFSQLLRERSTK